MAEEKMSMDGMRNPDFWKEYYQSVQGQIERINNLLKDLWTASEKPSFEFTDQIKLREVVDYTIDSLKEGFAAKKITVKNEISESLPVMRVDKPKFYRLFELLLKDEIATLPPGSEVKLKAEPYNGSNRPGILIQVTDNGPGLPQEALRLVFDPFVVRSDSPMEYGIHLMACYFIVHHHGGKIEARSEDGRGTTFSIRLPIDPDSTPTSNAGDTEFLRKVLLNDNLWEKLIASQ
jgi:signal transduction histidine kinase